MAIYKPARFSEETNPVNTLILDYFPAELGGNKFLLLKPLCLWYFVVAVLENEYNP